MTKIRTADADSLAVRDVMHAQLSSLDAGATVGDVRDYFAASTSRRLAFLTDDGRYAGSLTPGDVHDGGDPQRSALAVSHSGPVVSPDTPAAVGRDLALATDARRVPVVDGDQQLLGVVAVTGDLEYFCGTG